MLLDNEHIDKLIERHKETIKSYECECEHLRNEIARLEQLKVEEKKVMSVAGN